MFDESSVISGDGRDMTGIRETQRYGTRQESCLVMAYLSHETSMQLETRSRESMARQA